MSKYTRDGYFESLNSVDVVVKYLLDGR